MASSDVSDESSDWEEIQYPYKEQNIEHEPVTRDDLYDGGSSIFPPSEHEDLPVILEAPESPPPSPALQAPVSDAVPPQEKHIKSDSKLWVGIYKTGKRVAALLGSCFQSHRCPPFVPAAAALAVAIFACVKILQWRNHLLVLMREKDQRISQLLHQIAHMNEILSARRRVPVLRVN